MGLSVAAKVFAGAVVGAEALFALTRDTSATLRPPGASNERDFLARCVKCGRCIEACPYRALYADRSAIGPASGAPTLDVRSQACRLCEDLPCIKACPTEALHPLQSRRDVRMGIAVIDRELCIAVKAMRCEVCYRACPLIDEAIAIDFRMREGDSIHSVFEPIIDTEKCTGCGLCVERCPIGDPEPAIGIVRDRDEALRRIEAEQAKTVV